MKVPFIGNSPWGSNWAAQSGDILRKLKFLKSRGGRLKGSTLDRPLLGPSLGRLFGHHFCIFFLKSNLSLWSNEKWFKGILSNWESQCLLSSWNIVNRLKRNDILRKQGYWRNYHKIKVGKRVSLSLTFYLFFDLIFILFSYSNFSFSSRTFHVRVYFW